MDLFADIASAILLFAGVVLGSLGIWGTWKEWAPSEESFWSPIKRPLSIPWNAALRHLRRLFGKEREQHLSGSATATLRVSGHAKAQRGPGKIPPPDDIEAFAKAVTEQISGAFDYVNQIRGQLDAERQKREEMERELRGELHSRSSEIDATMRQAMTDGLHLEAFGLFLVALSGVSQVLKLMF